MTCREKLKMEHPDCFDEASYGGCIDCPSSYGYLKNPVNCEIDQEICTRCWDREIPGTESTNAIEIARGLADLRTALRKEGFTSEEAMRIIVAYLYRGVDVK